MSRMIVLGALLLFLAAPTQVPAQDGAVAASALRSDWSAVSIARGLMGLASLVGIAWLLSFDRRRTPWRLVLIAIAMQVILGLLLIRWSVGIVIFERISQFFVQLLAFSEKGSGFVFGETTRLMGDGKPALAFTALPTIIFFSCLMAVLYHLRVMHVIIWILAKVMTKLLGVTGAESMAMAANIFVGQTEAPLVIRRFVPTMTKSELMSLMTGGFATVAGSVMAAYIALLSDAGGAEFVPHLLIASVMSAPAAFAISKIVLPEAERSETGADMKLEFTSNARNVLDAATTGVSDGLKLWANVFAMLLAFMAMVALIDHMLGAVSSSLSLENIFGHLFAPLAWLMGVEGDDVRRFGTLLGIKTTINEFVAYLSLQNDVRAWSTGAPGAMSERSLYMATYALCGFANFSSIGIQIGGIAPMAPERRQDIIALALRAMVGGGLAACMTASIAGMFF